MNILKSLASVALMAMAVCAQAQDLKFGHIDSQAFLAQQDEFKEAQTKLQSEADQIQANFQAMQDDLQKKYQEYISQREQMPELVRATKEKEIQDGQERLQSFQQMAQQSLSQKEQQLLQPIYEKYKNALAQVGEEGGFVYIFDVASQVVLYHSNSSIDVAPLVQAKFK